MKKNVIGGLLIATTLGMTTLAVAQREKERAMPDQLRSRHLGGISVLSLLLIIAGCSSGQSTTGVVLSKELSQCYTEYVNLHGDIKKAYKAQLSSGIASQSEYGKAHYEIGRAHV